MLLINITRNISYISHNGAMLHMLLFNINTKAYVGSLFVQLPFILVTLIGQSQGHSDFEALYRVKERS